MEAFHIVGGYNLVLTDFDPRREPLGLLMVWEEPKAGERYVIGVDTSDGLGKDRSVIEVNRVGTESRPDELVAELCINCNPLYLPPFIYTIGNLYKDSDGSEALVAIEVNRGDGQVVQEILLRDYSYSYLYVRESPESRTNLYRNQWGWRTDQNTRPKICARGIKYIKENRWRINSPWFVEELADFEYNPEKQEMKAAAGAHDDRVMAGLIALWCSKDWSLYEEVSKPTVDEVSDKPPEAAPDWAQCTDISAEEAEQGPWSDDLLYTKDVYQDVWK